MNSFNLTGRLANNPIAFNNSTLLVKFTVAVKSSYKNKDGEYRTDFLSCSAWGKTAELINTHFTKGMLIGITGHMAASEYTKNDIKIYNNDLIADNIDFLQSKSSSSVNNNDEMVEDFGTQVESEEDDIPF